MQFPWDDKKDQANRAKHGVSFEIAMRVFADPFALSRQDRIENGEYRWQTLGMVDGILLLLVAHTLCEEDGEETIRIILARRADQQERKRYEQENR
jgi:uncharacterized DUF497 family protein